MSLTSIVKVAAATALYGGMHSLLAGRTAKAAAARLLGPRSHNAFYRLFYMGCSAAGLAALARYASRLPDRELYRAPAPWSRLLQCGQTAGLLLLLGGIRHIGPTRFLGLASLTAWLRARPCVPPAPEGQGPSPRADGALQITGPFRSTRHPLEFGLLVMLWLTPRLTANGLAFNAVTTLYTLVGTVLEERRLRAAYGDDYGAYQASRVPFLVPRLPRRAGGGDEARP